MVSGFQTIIDAAFNPVFGWMLNVPPILALLVLATFLALVSTLLQKYLTDQAKMRRLKEDIKKYQEQVKKLRSEPGKAMKVQQKMMPVQLELMKESFKPLLYSLIPFLLIFFWLGSHFAYYSLTPNTPFVVSATVAEGVTGTAVLTGSEGIHIEYPEQQINSSIARWMVSGPAGEHTINVTFSGATFTRQVLITTERKYEPPQTPLPGVITSFDVENKKLTPLGEFTMFGWKPGWIFYYILFSIPLSLLLKKWLNVV